MKKILLIIVIFFLTSCTQAPNKKQDAIDPVSPVTKPVDPPEDLNLKRIQASFSNGPHAAKFSCEECHSVEGGVIVKELAWVDDSSGQINAISAPTQLCVKCHEDQAGRNSPESAVPLAHADFECTHCHNPHGGQASCTQSTCHADIRSIISAQVEQPNFHSTSGDPNSYMCGGSACHELARQVSEQPVYHRPVHRNVPCYVCHDGSGFSAIKIDSQSWISIDNSDPVPGSSGKQVISHMVAREVECSKCHYYNNPWMLLEILPDS